MNAPANSLITATFSMRTWTFIRLVVALVIGQLAALPAYAQNGSQAQPWYQVELIIFSQTLSDHDAQEYWPSDIVLAYPLGTTRLKASPSTQSAPAMQPGAFYELNAEQHQLTAVKNSLRKSSKYRVLRHLAWQQPGLDENQIRPVIITGGEKFGEHYELEGTITLKLSRYLHLQTNLWLTQFYPNYGQQSGYTKWPNLPSIPGQTNSKSRTSQVKATGYSSQWSNSKTQNNQADSFGLDDALPGSSEGNRPPYIVDNIIFNQQSRKMRAEEIHYIDHPAMGIIAKITAIDRNKPIDQEPSLVTPTNN